MSQHVYVICNGDTGPCKIGIAKDPVDRLRTFQTANWAKLKLHATFPASRARKLERAVHRHLASFRMEGEWFDVPPADAITAVHTVANRPRRGFGPWRDRLVLRVKIWWRGRV